MRSGGGSFGGSSSSSSSSYSGSGSGSGSGDMPIFSWLIEHSMFFRLLFVGFFISIIVGLPFIITWGVMTHDTSIMIQPGENLKQKYSFGTAKISIPNADVEVYIVDSWPDQYTIGYHGVLNQSFDLYGQDYRYFERYYTRGSNITIDHSFGYPVDFFIFGSKSDYSSWKSSEGEDNSQALYHKYTDKLNFKYPVNQDNYYYFVLYNPSNRKTNGTIDFIINATQFDMTGYDRVEPNLYEEPIGNGLKLVLYNPSHTDAIRISINKSQPDMISDFFLGYVYILGICNAVVLLWGLYLDIYDLGTYLFFRTRGHHPDNFDIDVRSIKGIGVKREKQLSHLNIHTLEDLVLANESQLIEIGFYEKLAFRVIDEARTRTGIEPEEYENIEMTD